MRRSKALLILCLLGHELLAVNCQTQLTLCDAALNKYDTAVQRLEVEAKQLKADNKALVGRLSKASGPALPWWAYALTGAAVGFAGGLYLGGKR